jgi:hypothetical protein
VQNGAKISNFSVKEYDVGDTNTSKMEIWPLDSDSQYQVRIEGHLALAPFTDDAHRASVDDRLILLYVEAYGKAHLNKPDAQFRVQQVNKRLMLLKGRQHGNKRYVRGKMAEEQDAYPRPQVTDT